MEQFVPSKRRDLDITPRIDDSGMFRYLIHDPVSEEIYEMGEEEYLLFSLLDGRTSLKDVRNRYKDRYGKDLSTETLEAFTRKLHSMRLLQPDGCGSLPFIIPELETKSIHLGYPDKVIRFLEKAFGALFTKTFLFPLVLLTMISVGIVIKHSGEYVYELQLFRKIWGPVFFLLIPVLGYFMLYPLNAIVKGLACRHLGGQVSGFHLAFIMRFIPNFILDISDALWAMENHQRLKIFWAGILSLLFLWDISVIIWQSTLPWTHVHLFFTVFSLAVFVFMFLNLNPFVVRDGYLILQTWLDVNDLKQRAENHVRSLLFFTPQPEPLTEREKRIFTIYGMLSYAFRMTLTVLLLVAAGFILTEMFNGIGALLVLALVCLRFENTIRKVWLSIPFNRKLASCEAGKIRLRLIITLVLFILFIFVLFIPYPFEAGGEFRILPKKQQGVRAEVAGTIEEVFIIENQKVSKGQPLARLDDLIYRNNIDMIKAGINETQALIELRKSGPKPEEIAAAEQQVEVARKSLEYSVQEEVRHVKMLREKAIPETEYQFVKHRRDLDKETLKSAKKNLEVVKSGARPEEIQALEARRRKMEVELIQAKADLEHTTLYSPIDGIIISPNLSQKVGQRLENGDLLAVVEDSSRVLAEIEVSESDINEIIEGARVKLRTWANPLYTLEGEVIVIAPAAYEKSRHRITRTLTEREQLFGERELLRKEGRVVRVLAEFTEDVDGVKSDMTGYAKIECDSRPVALAFSRWLIRLIFVEVWSWIP